MTTVVTCTYSAFNVQGASTGTIKLTDCTPGISNDETLSGVDVVIIVAILVVLGLVGQFIMHHINRKALMQVWQPNPQA